MIDTLAVREYQPEDVVEVERLFRANGFDYELPDPTGSDILSCMLLTDGEKTVMAALLRKEVNCMLLVDHRSGTPVDRWQRLQALHELARQKAEDAGIKEANAWLPPGVEKQFAPRLEMFGWKLNLWPNYSRKVKES